MPDQAPAPASQNPGLPASPGQQTSPVGISPASQSTPNKGLEMAGMQGLGLALKILESLVPRLGSQTPAGKAAVDAIKLISKHVEPGMVSQAGNRNEMMNQMQKMQQMRQQMARPQGGPGAAPPQAGAAPMMGPGAGAGPPPAQAA